MTLQIKQKDLFQFLPDIGFKYVGEGGSVILASVALTDRGVFLSDQEQFAVANRIQTYFDATKGRPKANYEISRIFTSREFREFRTRYVYKFVNEDTFRDYNDAGSFLLSSLERFRHMEEQGDPAGDRFEGSSFCFYKVGNQELSVASISGFNSYIFSTTRDLSNVAEMQAAFGHVILRIDLVPFAHELARLVGAVSPEIRSVRYADLKLYRGDLHSSVVGEPFGLNPELATAVRRRSRLPALFAKPSRFELEREVRIAITQGSDVEYARPVQSERLRRYVQRLN